MISSEPTPDSIAGKKLIPRLVVGCLAFCVLMSLACYGIWLGTKDYFIQKAKDEGVYQESAPMEKSLHKGPENKLMAP
jgi:hypothetical protein